MNQSSGPEQSRSMPDRNVPNASPAARPAGRWVGWLIAFVLIIGVGAIATYALVKHNDSEQPVGEAGGRGRGSHGGNQSTPVTVAVARKGDMDRLLVGLGSVTPFNTATIRSRVDGQIMKVNFAEGQLVKSGDPLFDIDPRPYQVQLETAQGQMVKDQAQLENARLNVQRDTEAKEAISAQTLSTDKATQAQAEGAVKIDQAQIDSANLQLTYAHITSPLAGRIGLRLVDEGNLVHATDSTGLAVITQLQPIAVIFSLPEDDIPRVVQSMKENPNLKVDAYARDLRTLLASGKLLTIDNQVDATAGTFRLKAEFTNENNSLFPSQFVSARLLAQTIHGTTIIPSAAVQQGPDFTYVYIVKEDKTVQLRRVTVTAAAGNEIIIASPRPPGAGDEASVESGVQPGETVVVDGIDKLKDGAAVSFGEKGGEKGGEKSGGPTSAPSTGGHGHRAGGSASRPEQ